MKPSDSHTPLISSRPRRSGGAPGRGTPEGVRGVRPHGSVPPRLRSPFSALRDGGSRLRGSAVPGGPRRAGEASGPAALLAAGGMAAARGGWVGGVRAGQGLLFSPSVILINELLLKEEK